MMPGARINQLFERGLAQRPAVIHVAAACRLPLTPHASPLTAAVRRVFPHPSPLTDRTHV